MFALFLSINYNKLFLKNLSVLLTNMSECVVLIEQGRLNGKICTNYTGKSYYSFQGIPYAKAPLDELRFKVFIIT